MNFYIIVEKCDAIFAQKGIRKKSYCNQALKSDRIAKCPETIYEMSNLGLHGFLFLRSHAFSSIER